MSRDRDPDAELRRAHLRWFTRLSAQQQLAHLRDYDGLPPRAQLDLTSHQGRVAAHAKRHRPPRGGGRR